MYREDNNLYDLSNIYKQRVKKIYDNNFMEEEYKNDHSSDLSTKQYPLNHVEYLSDGVLSQERFNNNIQPMYE